MPIEPLVLLRMETVAVSLGGFAAYPAGIELTLAVRRRGADDAEWVDRQMYLRRRRGGEVPPEFLRFGVEFADGRKATNLGWHMGFDRLQPPDRPILVGRGGGGGGARFDQRYWLWPLPPAGRLTFVAEWPSEGGVALTRVDVDGRAILEASTRATTLWEPETTDVST